MKDLMDELGRARRSVGTGTLPGGEAQVVTVSRHYDASVDDVWDAITAPERIKRWFLPVSGDLREGGNYQLEGNAGGEIRTCDPPRHLCVTWIFGEPPGPEDSSIVDVHLEPGDDGTVVTLHHTAVVPAETWAQYGPGAVGVGWDLAFVGLAAHLGGVELGDPAALESDPAMRDALAASASKWGDAYRAAGADDDTVERTTAETTAFYVPPPPD